MKLSRAAVAASALERLVRREDNSMTAKEQVMEKYPKAYAAQDIDGFWHIWCPTVRGALSGGPWKDARSAAKAWKLAADKLAPNNR